MSSAVCSCYLSQRNTSPEGLFGGEWESISCRFLFSTDSNHSVDSTGGEEMHRLTENEMPSHSHNYQGFTCSSTFSFGSVPGSGYYLPYTADDNFKCSSCTGNEGGNQPHNNMPPYITAYCWRRYR